MVNLQDTPSAGMLTAADLEEARRVNPGSVWMPRRHVLLSCPPCTGACNQGRQCAARTPAEACAELGAESMLRHRRASATAKNVALALLLAVAGYLAHITWPLA